MGFYIVFNNLSSLLKASQSVDIAKDIEMAVTNSADTVGIDVSEVSQVTVSVESDGKILLKVDDSSDGSEGAVSAIDYDKGAAALLSQIPAAFASEAEFVHLPKIEPEVFIRDEDNQKFYPVYEKLEIDLRYRIDYADIFRSRQEIENSGSVSKPVQKNLEKERTGQNRHAERRFQEKQAENFRESLKQKRLASELQNKNK